MSESLVPPVLNPSSLYKEEAKRDATRIRIYNMVLSQIYTKVKAVSRIPGNERSLMYVIPEFIPGTPRFDIGDAVLYIVWNLRNAGYTVNYTHPNLLYIHWKLHDERYKQNDSPWSIVLNTVRNAVVQGTTEPSVRSPAEALKPAAATDIQKRKTPLKKTIEFQPPMDVKPATSSHPNVAGSLYSGAVQAPPRLPGQLSEKHVSFV
jgi:hypothetical protein